ncbi:MAG: Zn-dependent exopeptidase M28 [Coriobacteriia bacterium]|nr:Zn-dependent exopeptidase M28 [Coriobacteriia bacterium]
MAEMMQHLTALADEIGPRPATTDAEHRAAAYVESVFVARGVEPEIQEFDAPRTYSWAYVIYHLLTIVSAVCAGAWLLGGKLMPAAVALSALSAVMMFLDLDTRWGISSILPKGPSQNVIARHVPKARRNEKLKKVIVVAHYDSARSSLAFSPGMVGQFGVTFTLMKTCTFLVPMLLLIAALPLPIPTAVKTYIWYAAVAASAYLVIPMLINIHRELAMPFVAGAGDNASGVAAMLGVFHNIVPEPDSSRFVTSQFTATRHSEDVAREAGVVPEGAALSYSSGSSESLLPDDFDWADSGSQIPSAPSAPPARARARLPEFETIEFGAVGSPAPTPPSRSSAPTRSLDSDWADDAAEGLGATGTLGMAEPPRTMDPTPEQPPKRGLFSGLSFGRKKKDEPDVKGWLGVDDEFDARKAGKDIGSWDNFGAEGEGDDDTDGFGWKGGWAGDDPIEDVEFAANEAARIRRRVTEMVDRDLFEKEVWFVATGAEEVGTVGMQAFLAQYGEEVRDALIINIDNVGAGQLSWVTAEGMIRRYRASARLVGLARRVSREQEILVKPRVYKGLSTDATPALARGYKAMTIMAFDSKGLPVNWHWKTDTSSEIEPEVVERATELVTSMIRDA